MRRIPSILPLFVLVFATVVLSNSLAQSGQEAAPPKDGNASSGAGSPAPASSQAGDSTKLELIKSERARYPLQAQEKGIQGQVMLKLHVSETGDVESVDVISGHPVLIPAATDAAKKWRFKPYIRNGKPIKVSVDVPVDFAFTDNIVRDTRDNASPAPTSASTASTNAVKVGSGVMRGLLIYEVAPVYPTDARRDHVQGTVLMQASISKDGRVTGLTVVSGPKELRDSAVGAVQQWRYRPYMIDGEPVEVTTQIQVNYQLR